MDNYLGLKKVNGASVKPIFQKVLETARGGFSLDATGLTARDTIPAGTPKQNSALEESILKLQQTVENLQKERISGDLGAAVRTKLKETLKMTDKEIESVMYGRTFESAEQVEEFVTKQEELYQDITKERIEHQAGSGFVPMISQGNVNKAAIENDIKEFNEKY